MRKRECESESESEKVGVGGCGGRGAKEWDREKELDKVRQEKKRNVDYLSEHRKKWPNKVSNPSLKLHVTLLVEESSLTPNLYSLLSFFRPSKKRKRTLTCWHSTRHRYTQPFLTRVGSKKDTNNYNK